MRAGTRSGRGVLAGLIGCVALGATACSGLTGGGGGSTSGYPVGTIATGLAADLTNPSGDVPGANIWTCKPSSAHPYPVVMVHGTMGSAAFTWQALGPMLANAGYCVYELNYGGNPPFYGLGEIGASAGQLATFVDKVLASTGAAKVDMVGHSQGGMMPRYYIQDLGGASKVHMLVGLAASNEGTTADGLTTLGNNLGVLTTINGMMTALFGTPAFAEQEQGSSFLTALNKGGGTSSGVSYVNIESKYDEVVTPYTNAFLPAGPNVQNITLQNSCSTDYTEHIGIVYDPVALADVMNAFGADSPDYTPPCSTVLPVIGSIP